MNSKENLLDSVLRIGVECCSTKLDDLCIIPITLEDVLGKKKTDNILMTRCMIVSKIRALGYSVETIAKLFKRTPMSIRNIVVVARQYHDYSSAYRMAERELDNRLCDLIGENIPNL